MRLFVGVSLAEDLREALAALLPAWRERAPELKWVKPENLHLTLKFLGETDPAILPDLRLSLNALSERPAFVLSLGTVVGIPPGRRARVLALAVDQGERELARLARALSQAVRPMGFPRETRAFRAHLTLARARRGDILPPDLISGIGEAPELPVHYVKEFCLFQSRLQPGGPIYRRLETISLSG